MVQLRVPRPSPLVSLFSQVELVSCSTGRLVRFRTHGLTKEKKDSSKALLPSERRPGSSDVRVEGLTTSTTYYRVKHGFGNPWGAPKKRMWSSLRLAGMKEPKTENRLLRLDLVLASDRCSPEPNQLETANPTERF